MVFLRLLPRLSVRDLAAEVGFYERLGFTSERLDDGLVALTADDVLFGLHETPGQDGPAADVPYGLAWQMEVDDVHAVHAAARAAHLVAVEEPRQQAGGPWTLRLRTPNGYLLVLQSRPDAAFGIDVRTAALALPGVVELQVDGHATYRVGDTVIGVQRDAQTVDVHLRPRDVPQAGFLPGVVPTGAGVRVDLRTVAPECLEELLHTSHARYSPPVPEGGSLRTE